MHVERTLQRAANRDITIRCDLSNHALGLDVELLLSTRFVFAFDDDVILGESGVHVPARDQKRLKDVVRPPHDGPGRERLVYRMHGRQGVKVDRDETTGPLDDLFVGMREKHDRLLGMVHDVLGEAWLVVENQDEPVRRRHILRGHDSDLLPGNAVAESNLSILPERMASHRDAMQHARQRHIVDVPRRAGDLGASFSPRHGLADKSRHWGKPYTTGLADGLRTCRGLEDGRWTLNPGPWTDWPTY